MTHLARSILTIMLIWAAASFAAQAQDTRITEDIAMTKATISLLAAKNFAAIRDRLDATIGNPSDDMLGRMSGLLGTGEASSIETIGANERHSVETGNGSSQILLEYGWTGKWVVVEAVVKTEGGSKRFTRLYLTANHCLSRS